MRRTFTTRHTIILFVAVATGCSYDSAAPNIYDLPPTAPPTTTPGNPPSTSGGPDVTPLINGLWTSSGSGHDLLRLSTTQLGTSATITAATVVTSASASLSRMNSIAFGADGTLWTASQDDNVLVGFAPSRLSASGSSEATTVISSANGSLDAPSGLAFDRRHRLWVSSPESNSIVRYDSAQLAAGGAPTPALRLSGVGHPTAIAFDTAGALWMVDTRNHRVVKFGAAKIAATGAPTPDVIFTARNGSLQNPSGLAFDATGRLWIANGGNQSIVAFATAQLLASGSPEPSVVLTESVADGAFPAGLAFDGGGALWVTNRSGVLTQYARSVLGASGAPVPAAVVRLGGRSQLWSAAFWPTPRGLPIN